MYNTQPPQLIGDFNVFCTVEEYCPLIWKFLWNKTMEVYASIITELAFRAPDKYYFMAILNAKSFKGAYWGLCRVLYCLHNCLDWLAWYQYLCLKGCFWLLWWKNKFPALLNGPVGKYISLMMVHCHIFAI